MPQVTVVAPAHNEEESLPEFHRRLSGALAGEDYELLIVDDGSTDGTAATVRLIARDDPRVRLVRLSRNFGHQAAVTAGIDLAQGEAVVTIDADLQDPPEVIPELLAAWREGHDVVHAARHTRPGEPRWRLWLIRSFYRVFGRVAGLETYPGNSGDFRLIAGPALVAVRRLTERTRFLRGLVSWVGYRQTTIFYEREARFAGESKYPLSKLIRLAADGIISFSAVPLRLAAFAGSIFSLCALVAIPVVLILKIVGAYTVPGTATLSILVLFIGGVQLVFLGVIGEYLARVYDENKHRPLYLVREDEDVA